MFTPPPSPLPPRTKFDESLLVAQAQSHTPSHSSPQLSPSSMEDQEKESFTYGYFDIPTNHNSGYSRTPPLSLPLPSSSPKERSYPSLSPDAKRTIGRRWRWAVLCVPVALVVLTWWLTRPPPHHHHGHHHPPPHHGHHREGPYGMEGVEQEYIGLVHDHEGSVPLDWRPHDQEQEHERNYHHKRQAVATSSSNIVFPSSSVPAATTVSSIAPASTTAGATTTIPAASQALPTIPSVAPPLPTPFPQPFDSSLQANFSTQGCQDFFLNMTESAPFRSCRPFGMLLQSSAAFVEAQTNLSLLNSVIYGTCNTDLPLDQCNANFAWFATSLQSACTEELEQENEMAVQALLGLQSYNLLRSAGCLTDPTSNAYCYVEAAQSKNPADLYFYELPIGLPLPNTTQPSCDSCTKSLMGLFADSLQQTNNGSSGSLDKTYSSAQQSVSGVCGSGYAQAASGAMSLSSQKGGFMVAALVMASVLVWVIL